MTSDVGGSVGPDHPAAGLRPVAHLGAAVLLGQAVAAGQAGFSPAALALVAAAIALIAIALFLPDTVDRVHTVVARGTVARGAVVRGTVAVGLALALWRLPLVDLYVRAPILRPKLGPFVLLAGVSAALLAAVAAGRPRRIQPACLPLLLTTFTLMGAFYLGLSPDPKIDVYRFGRFGCEAMLDGRDPYAITIPDPYGPRVHFYADGVVVGGRILCGYCYPPLTLLLSLPGHVLAGDVRYADLAAIVLTAGILGYGFPRRTGVGAACNTLCRTNTGGAYGAAVGPEDPPRRGRLRPEKSPRRAGATGPRLGTLAAVLLLFAPGGLHLLENAWTEPFLILLVATTTALAARGWLRCAAVSAGLLLASKQYVPLAAPAFLLLVPRPWTGRGVARWTLIAGASGLAVTLPFLLWNSSAFYRSLTVLNVGVIRSDAISFLPPLLRATGWHVPLLACPMIAAVVVGGLVVCRSPRTPAGFAAGFALISLCVFAVSPLAFGNYYTLAVGALYVSAAADA